MDCRDFRQMCIKEDGMPKLLHKMAIAIVAAAACIGATTMSSTPASASAAQTQELAARSCRVVVTHRWRHGRRVTVRRRICHGRRYHRPRHHCRTVVTHRWHHGHRVTVRRRVCR